MSKGIRSTEEWERNNKKIFEFIKANPSCTNRDLINHTGLHKTTVVTKHLVPLRKRKLVRRVNAYTATGASVYYEEELYQRMRSTI
jgi:predicted HTH transcriptional regulator